MLYEFIYSLVFIEDELHKILSVGGGARADTPGRSISLY